MRTQVVAILAMSLPVAALPANAQGDPARKQADDILAATQVQGGLIVHLGCGGFGQLGRHPGDL